MRRAAKVDKNHAAIVEYFRVSGCKVQSLASIGDGCPDLLLYRPRCNRFALVEVKHGAGKLNEDQRTFSASWPVHVVRNLIDAQKLLQLMDEAT